MRKFTIFLLLISSYCFAQVDNTYINKLNAFFPTYPKSPSTAEFERYGGVQNSEYTGANSPKINLLTIEQGNVKIPLDLVYTSGNGVKVAQEASTVGLGWSMPLPVITQTVMGFDDFDDYFPKMRPDFATSSTPQGEATPFTGRCHTFGNNFNPDCEAFVGSDLYTVPPSFDTFGYYKGYEGYFPFNRRYQRSLDCADLSVVDTEPDVFVLNLFGEKIEFTSSRFPTYGCDYGSIEYLESINKSGYEIFPTQTILGVITGFLVKDVKGNEFYFNNLENVVVSGLEYTLLKQRNYLLTQIVDYKGNQIDFEYMSISHVFNLPNQSQVLCFTYRYSPYTNLNLCGPSNYWDKYDTGGSLSFAEPSPNTDTKVTHSNNTSSTQNNWLIKKISGDFGQVVFKHSNRDDLSTKKLDKLLMYAKNDTINSVKHIDFAYDYFLSDTSSITQSLNPNSNINYNQKRLKLNTVKINNQNPYIFEYNNIQLPPKHSYAVDYWGYYNGGNNNNSYILNTNDFNFPSLPITSGEPNIVMNITDNFKRSSLIHAQAAILEKITYPTKGYSVFEYEENVADNLFYQYGNLTKGNGLRLKSHRNYDSSNISPASLTIYEYFEGKSMNPLLLYDLDTHYSLSPVYSQGVFVGAQYSMASFVRLYSNSIFPSSPLSNGDYVGYGKVVKKEVKDSSINGYTETVYTNNLSIFFNPKAGVASVRGNNHNNGMILSQKISDNFSVKQEVRNSYQTFFSDFDYGVVMKNGTKFYISYIGVDGCFWGGTNAGLDLHAVSFLGYYPIYSSETLLKSSETIKYHATGNITTKTDYTYDSEYRQLKTETTHTSDNKEIKTEYKYPYDITNPITIVPTDLTVPVETKTYQDNNLIASKRISYGEFGSPVKILPKEVYLSKGNQTEEKGFTYHDYYSNGNVKEYSTENGIKTVILWGYNNTLPVAKIENSDFATIAALLASQGIGTESINESHQVQLNGLRTSLPNAMITTYTHKPLVGVSTITDPRGITVYYDYDEQNRLKSVRDHEGNLVSEHEYKYKN